jgi:hypothetical protein
LPAVTVTLKVQLAVSPAWFVAVHVSLVVPIGNAEPDGVLHTVLTEQLSETAGANVTAAVHLPKSTGVVMLLGQVIVGDVVSYVGVTVTSPTTPSFIEGRWMVRTAPLVRSRFVITWVSVVLFTLISEEGEVKTPSAHGCHWTSTVPPVRT